MDLSASTSSLIPPPSAIRNYEPVKTAGDMRELNTLALKQVIVRTVQAKECELIEIIISNQQQSSQHFNGDVCPSVP